MPDRDTLFRNDNIRTPHLKCESCHTQIFLTRIERADDGCEVRSFQCPHCTGVTTLRIEPEEAARERDDSAAMGDRGS